MVRSEHCASVRAKLCQNGAVSEPYPRRHDPTVLRAIAHPTRNRILHELEASGSLRAADVARLLEIPANQASFHLRQLAKYGLIEPAPDQARDGRDRVWRVVDEGRLRLSLDEMLDAPGGPAAVKVWQRNASGWAHQVVDEAYTLDRSPGVMRAITEQPLRLTRQEAQELCDRLDAVLQEVLREKRDADDDAERSTYLLFSILQPYPQRTGP
jgi:DNA-binding transcriptional ArsR family regulator